MAAAGSRTYRIPGEFLRGTKEKDDQQEDPQDDHGDAPDGAVPLIMFINCSSGGLVGPALANRFADVVGASQVFDLAKQDPDSVLSRLFKNLGEADERGNKQAAWVRQKLRVLACGGDGTVAWILTAIWRLELQPPPPVAVIPLGTGNGLSINFGWGKTMRPQWLQSSKSMHQELQAVVQAKQRDIDLWKVSFDSPSVKFDDKEVPDSLTMDSSSNDQQPHSMRGMFVYYYSFGLDAEVAYRFHELRKTHPRIASKRKVNETLYASMGVRTGWFCGARPLRDSIATIKVRKDGEDWHELKLASSIYAIVIINLQTYSGGRDIWGLHDSDGEARRPEEVAKQFHKPIFDDGLIEVVGLKNGWHTWAVLSQVSRRVHGQRCAQGHEVLVEFRRPASGGTAAFMRLDGEPWMQDLTGTSTEQPLRVHIRHGGKSSMLLNTEALPGTATRALKLAEREYQLSNEHPATSEQVQKSPTITS